jgi:integrase
LAYAISKSTDPYKTEQDALLSAISGHPRDHPIFSLALGTGLRLAEIVGLDVGDVYFPDGTPRARMRLRRGIAKGGRAGEGLLTN